MAFLAKQASAVCARERRSAPHPEND